MDLFLLKKIFSALIMPLSIVMILLFLALIFHRSKAQFSFKCLVSATLLLFISAFPPFANWVMAPIESQYPSYTSSVKPVDYIIVLGCAHINDMDLPATSQLQICSLQRLVEAIRIYRLHPEAIIITSGRAGAQKMSNAQVVKQAAVSLGVPANKIITENYPKDTEEEAQLIAPRVIGKNVVLVTNANHMPRAMKYFQQYGVTPIAAPSGYWVKGIENKKTWLHYFPRTMKIKQTTTAWYESIGRLWQWLKTLTV
jgi:uncharacterized SAM-binding protein YcdF (DUF218 family)